LESITFDLRTEKNTDNIFKHFKTLEEYRREENEMKKKSFLNRILNCHICMNFFK